MNENDRYGFPENLKRLREERNLKGIQMAEKLNIVQQAYSNYELGLRTPSIYILIEIAEILEVSLDTLILKDSSSLPSSSADAGNASEAPRLLSEPISDPEQRLLAYFRLLAPEHQCEILDYCEFKQKRYS